MVIEGSRSSLQRPTCEISCLLTVNLETLSGSFHYEYPALVIHLYRYRSLERFLPLQQALGPLPTPNHRRFEIHPFSTPFG